MRRSENTARELSGSLALIDADVSRGATPVLSGVSVEFEFGQITAVVGPNGSGKTTMLESVTALLPLDCGERVCITQSVSSPVGLPDMRGSVSYLPQVSEIVPEMTVAHTLEFTCWLDRMSRDRAAGRMALLRDRMDLSSVWDTQARRLSGGTQRRLALACALVTDPRFLILDEPLAGVDTEHRARIRRLLLEESSTRCTIMSTHYDEDVRSLADRVVVVGRGSVVYAGRTGDFLSMGVDPQPGELATEAAMRTLVAARRAKGDASSGGDV